MFRTKYSFLFLLILLVGNRISAQQIMQEDFNSGLPSNWNIVDGGNSSQTWEHVQDYNGNDLDGTPFMFVNSDASQGDHLLEELVTPSVDASNADEAVVTFDHFFANLGSEKGYVDVYDGSNWVQVASFTSDAGNWGDPENAEVDLAPHRNPNMQVRFRYDDDASWGLHWAIDNVVIKNKQCFDPSDIEVLEVNPNSAYVTWDTEAPNSASWEVRFGPSGFSPGNGDTISTNNDTVAIGPLNANTEYDFYVREHCPNGQTTDWIQGSSFRTRCNALTLPYGEDMESFSVNDNATGFICWIPDPMNTTGDYRWNTGASGNQNSTSTGPIYDHTQGAGGNGIYAFTEASSGSQGDEAILSSSTIDLTNIDHPLMSFWYHMFGVEMGSLHVDVSTDGGSTWQNDVMSPLVGQQQGGENSPWKKAYVDLGAYNGGFLMIRFRGVRGVGYESDMAIDDIQIREGPLKDLKAKNFVSPTDPDCFGVGHPIDIPIVNGGQDSIDFTEDTVEVTVEVSGPVNQTLNATVDDNSLNGGMPLGTMDSIVVNMGNLNMSANGAYDLIGYINSISGDTLSFNDTIVDEFQVSSSSGGTVSGGATICEGDSAELSVNGTNGQIQWQMNDGSGWSDIQGETSSELNTAPTDTTSYRVEACGSNTSNVDTLKVAQVAPPSNVQGDTFCLGRDGSANLEASGSGNFFWYEDSTDEDHVDTGKITETSVDYVDKTLWVSRSDFSTPNPVLITEVDHGTVDGVELQNVSQSPVDLSGWTVALNDAIDINDWPNDQDHRWDLNGTLNPGDIIVGDENNNDLNMGWVSNDEGGVILFDENDNVVDMVLFEWTQSEVNSFSPTIFGQNISLSGNWSGPAVSGCGSSVIYNRLGDSDNDEAIDWECDAPNMGSTNPELELPFGGCKSERVSVTAYAEECPGIEQFEEDIEFSLYPNPVERDRFQIRMEGEQSVEGILNIRDLSGRVLRNERRTLEKGVNNFDTRGMSQGVYMLSFKSESGNFHKKLVVK